MKKIIFLLLPILLFSMEVKDVIKGVDNSLLVKSSKTETEALKKMVGVYEGKNYPSIDLDFKAIRLKDVPTATFSLPLMPPITTAVGTKNNLSLELGFSYPIFTGYAVSNMIKKAKLKVVKSKLKTKNLKRELYLKAVMLYSDIYAISQAVKATKEALKALDISLKKANSLYKNALINLSEVYNIKAKRYSVVAELETLKAKRDLLVNMLYYVSGVKVGNDLKLKSIKRLQDVQSIIKQALKNREDIAILKKELDIAGLEIKLAKSKFYPTVAVMGGIKKRGDSLRLNGNGYSNADESYIALGIKWNIFDGFSKNRATQASRLKKEATLLYLNDYMQKVKTEIENSFFVLKSLKAKLSAAKEQLKSQEEYYKLVKGRFANALSSADELSRAIAALAKAKANVQQYKAKIFFQRYKIILQAGLKVFITAPTK